MDDKFVEDRMKHSYAVAKKMVEIGKKRGLSREQLEDLFVLGYNHDIGYFVGDGSRHNIVGSEMLRRNGYKYWEEVFCHGIVTKEYHSLYLQILNEADMQIDKCGNDVGYEKRLEDIKFRYGEDSSVYKNVTELIKQIKENEYKEIDEEEREC